MSAESAFVQKLRNNFFRFRRVEREIFSAKPVFFIGKEIFQGNNEVYAGQISGDMIRVCDADIGRRVRCDVGDDIIVNLSVVRIQPEIDGDIRI